MPSEIRHILFRPAEAARALLEHVRHDRRNLPTGDVIDCFVEPALPRNGHGRSVCLVVVLDPSRDLPRGGTGELLRLTLSGDALIEALIGFCEMRGIPLPLGGDKSLQRFGDQIGMIVTLDEDGTDEHILDEDSTDEMALPKPLRRGA